MGPFPVTGMLRAPDEASFYSIAAARLDGDDVPEIFGTRYVSTRYGDAVPVPFHEARNGPSNHLFQWRGGSWSDITEEAGLAEAGGRFSLSAQFVDATGDGRLDLYVVNDFGSNQLFERDRGASFRAVDSPVCDPGAGMGASWGDVDGDGDLDLHVTNMYSSAGRRLAFQESFGQELGEEAGACAAWPRGTRSTSRTRGRLRAERQRAHRDGPLGLGRGDDRLRPRRAARHLRAGGVPHGARTRRPLKRVLRRVAPQDVEGQGQRPRDQAGVTCLARWSAAFPGAGTRGTARGAPSVTGLSWTCPRSPVSTTWTTGVALRCDWDGDGDEDLWVRSRSGPALRYLENQQGTGRTIRVVSKVLVSSVDVDVEDRNGVERQLRLGRSSGTDGYLASSRSSRRRRSGTATRSSGSATRWRAAMAEACAAAATSGISSSSRRTVGS